MTLTQIAQMVVASIKSGRFTKASGQLRKNIWDDEKNTYIQGYCFLGCIAQLAVEAGVIPSFPTSGASLPYEVQRWVGFKHPEGKFTRKTDGGIDSLMSLNDGTGMTLAEIADVMASEPDGLFADADYFNDDDEMMKTTCTMKMRI
jgi:hypothetical protein